MAHHQTCPLCRHPENQAIDADLLSGVSERSVVARYGFARSTVHNHKSNHLGRVISRLANAREEYVAIREQTFALNIARELGRVIADGRAIADACAELLADPEEPGKFNVGPRSEEMWVTYVVVDPQTGKRRSRREQMSVLLERIESGVPCKVERVESKHADPRELILKAQNTVLAGIERATSLMRDAWELQAHLDRAAQIAEWSEVQCESRLRELLARMDLGWTEEDSTRFIERLRAVAAEEASKQWELAPPDDEPADPLSEGGPGAPQRQAA